MKSCFSGCLREMLSEYERLYAPFPYLQTSLVFMFGLTGRVFQVMESWSSSGMAIFRKPCMSDNVGNLPWKQPSKTCYPASVYFFCVIATITSDYKTSVLGNSCTSTMGELHGGFLQFPEHSQGTRFLTGYITLWNTSISTLLVDVTTPCYWDHHMGNWMSWPAVLHWSTTVQ